MKIKYAKKAESESIGTRIYPNQNDTFAKSYNWLLRRKELTPGAKHIYNRLTQYAGIKNYARVKQETLGLETAFNARQVRSYTKELVHFGLIEVQQLGLNKANLYYFLDHPWRHEQKEFAKLKHPHPIDNTQDIKIPNKITERLDLTGQERLDLTGQERLDLTGQERLDLTGQERLDLTGPLNRSSEKIQLRDKKHIEAGSVRVSPSPVSEYSLEEWRFYASSQKNVDDPEALARFLAKSKDNDPTMRKFLDTLKQKQQQQQLELDLKQKQELEQQQKREQERLELIDIILSQKRPLDDWDRNMLVRLGYNIEVKTQTS